MSDLKEIISDLLLTQYGVVIEEKTLKKVCKQLNPLIEEPQFKIIPVVVGMDFKECEYQIEARQEIKELVKTDLFKWFQEKEIEKVEHAIEATKKLIEQLKDN